jgi:hypothetical protein
MTMLVEVWPEAATFNYFKPGFNESPVDIYLRPWSLSIRKGVYDSLNTTGYKSLTFCYGDKKGIDHYYECTFDFVKSMVKRKNKYFAVTFMGRMTHDFLNNIYFVDQPIHDLLNKLFKQQLLIIQLSFLVITDFVTDHIFGKYLSVKQNLVFQ